MPAGFSWGNVKPPAGVQVDFSSPMVSEMERFWAFNEGAGKLYTDVIKGNVLATTGGAPAWVGSQLGSAVSFNGSSDSLTCLGVPAGEASLATEIKGYTLFALVTPASTSVATLGAAVLSDGTLGGYAFLGRNSSSWFGQHRISGAYVQINAGTAVPGQPSFIALIYDVGAGSVSLSIDGGPFSSVGSVANTRDFYGNNMYIGSDNGNLFFDGLIHCVGLYNRPLSFPEISRLSAQTYAMFMPPVYRRWFVSAAVAASAAMGAQYVQIAPFAISRFGPRVG